MIITFNLIYLHYNYLCSVARSFYLAQPLVV